MNIDIRNDSLNGGEQTLNKTGYMVGSLDSCSKAFAEFSGKTDGIVMDVGACYGIATLAALEKGAKTVIAVDNEPRHLEILHSRVPEEYKSKVEYVTGALPNDLMFELDSISAILCSRVLHLLREDEVEVSLKCMHNWLEPGGMLYLVNDTPYVLLDSFLPVYEQRKKLGVKWPGYIENSDIKEYVHPDFHGMCPDYLTFTDVDTLVSACERSGFAVVKAELMQRPDYPKSLQKEGGENVGIIAVKT